MSSNLTIVITASFIPTHPSRFIIEKTLESLKYINMRPGTKIVLAHDYNDSDDYAKYLKNINDYAEQSPMDIEIAMCAEHGHLVGNVRNAFARIASKYALVIQHDLPFVRKFDIQKVMEDMEENPGIKYVRFNKRSNIKTEFDAFNDLFGFQQIQKNYTYTRTPAWSDNNHLCLTSYYTDIVLKECDNGGPMEKILHGKITDIESHEKYGTYLFGPLEQKRFIKHTDGRKTTGLPVKYILAVLVTIFLLLLLLLKG